MAGAMNSFGTFDPKTVTFHPYRTSIGRYDYGNGHASKSFWDAKTQRRNLAGLTKLCLILLLRATNSPI